MKTLKRLTAWLDEDFNRAVNLSPTQAGYMCQLQFMAANGKRIWGGTWFDDSLEGAIQVAIDSKEWEDA